MNVSTGLIFGTMRLGALPENHSIDLLTYALERGIRTFHSSTEYDTFDLFSHALPIACQSANIDLDSIKHIVKIAAPHFDNNEFVPKELIEKTREYNRRLGCKKIEVVQWMIRHDLKDEAGRLEILSSNDSAIDDSISLLKDNGELDRFGCFPYTDSFRTAVMKYSWCDVLVDYFNPNETQALPTIERLRNDQTAIAIRPLLPLMDDNAQTDVHGQKWTYTGLIEYALQVGKIESLVISMSSKKHLDELVDTIQNYDRDKPQS